MQVYRRQGVREYVVCRVGGCELDCFSGAPAIACD
nr:hypothetical protein [Rubidibacter lacunae]